jgi:hypothetical protein
MVPAQVGQAHGPVGPVDTARAATTARLKREETPQTPTDDPGATTDLGAPGAANDPGAGAATTQLSPARVPARALVVAPIR